MCLSNSCFVELRGGLSCSAGYPITSWALKKFASHPINVVTMTNSTGQVWSSASLHFSSIHLQLRVITQVPSIGNFGLIDDDTPDWARTRLSFTDGSTEYTLVFSDEFNTDGRTFYPGDDPYWEAVDLHYWQTNNMEWYDPAAITTADGALQISLTQKETHGLDYQGGMIQTWNKFCFTGGLLETSVVLPGVNNVVGLWPAVWTMGNLGRAGYGASLEGMVRFLFF